MRVVEECQSRGVLHCCGSHTQSGSRKTTSSGIGSCVMVCYKCTREGESSGSGEGGHFETDGDGTGLRPHTPDRSSYERPRRDFAYCRSAQSTQHSFRGGLHVEVFERVVTAEMLKEGERNHPGGTTSRETDCKQKTYKLDAWNLSQRRDVDAALPRM